MNSTIGTIKTTFHHKKIVQWTVHSRSIAFFMTKLNKNTKIRSMHCKITLLTNLLNSKELVLLNIFHSHRHFRSLSSRNLFSPQIAKWNKIPSGMLECLLRLSYSDNLINFLVTQSQSHYTFFY